MNNHYNTLEIEKNATHDEIKKAFRRLSLLHHPDRNNGSNESNQKFQEISNAYEILSNNNKKRQYDLQNNISNINTEELFNFFTNSFFNQSKDDNKFNFMNKNFQKPVPIIKNIEININQAYMGCNIPIDITRWILENNVRREEKETLYVGIPRGVDNNEIIVLREKGNIMSDTNKGDIKIFVKVINNSHFERNGLDLIYHKDITLKDALCGFEFYMEHLNGNSYTISNGNGNIITHNYNKTIMKLGMVREENIGNIIIKFNVIFPKTLDKTQIEELKKIL